MSNLYLNGQQIPSGYTITIYKYEPFAYDFTPITGYLQIVSKSTLINPLVTQATSVSPISFWSPGYRSWDPQTQGYTGATSSAEQIVIGWGSYYVSGALVIEQTYTINVVIKAGRFVVPVLTDPSYTLYVNEAVSSTFGSDIQFQAPGALFITSPFTTPALPPGLSFTPVGGNPSLTWNLTGTPLIGSPSTSYTVYARGSSNTSFVISKVITIAIGPERIVTSVSPSSNILMTVDDPILPTVISARYPNSFTSNLSYAWSFLPDGLQFTDVSGNAVTSPFRPGDANSTMILTGTPTEPAAQLYRSAGVSNVVTNVVATRQTTPTLTATLPISLTFTRTVLFDPITVPTLYRNSPIDPSSIVFRANSYFPFGAGVLLMLASNLPPGLSLVHTQNDSNAYLVGTPTVGGSGVYDITAVNSNALARTINVPITVVDDIITFVGPTDTCYNFVISRPLSSSLSGYYPSNISYTAVSSSGGNVNISVSGISGLGISTSVVGSTITFGGVPDTTTSLSTATLLGSNPATGATGSYNFQYAVLTDDVSITNPLSRLNFVQNTPIDSVQFSGTTLSGRSIINWTSANIPDGLLLSSAGLLTGTPTSNSASADASFNVTASTGYVSETNPVTYRTIPDDIFITLVSDPTTVNEQFSNVELRATTYSGFSTETSLGFIFPIQESPITLGISNNLLSGDLGTASPGVLPSYDVRIDASYGLLSASQTFRVRPTNPSTRLRYILDASFTTGLVIAPPVSFPRGVMTLGQSFPDNNYSLSAGAYPWSQGLTTGNIDYGYIGDVAYSSNTAILVTGSRMYRSSNSTSWSLIPSTDISTIPGIVGGYYTFPPPTGLQTISGPILTSIATDGNSNWLALGVGFDSNNAGAQRTILRTSSNDGLTWTDVSSTSTFVTLDSNTRLAYNNGRYFITQSNATDPVLRADASDLTTWTGSSGGMPAIPGNIASTIAFYGNEVLCGGSGGDLYRSTNNGTTWSVDPGAFGSIRSISRITSNWLLVSDDRVFYEYDGGPPFSTILTANPVNSEIFLAGDYDGGAFQVYNQTTGIVGLKFLGAHNIQYDGTVGNNQTAAYFAPAFLKRALTRYIDNGSTSATITLGLDASLSFVEPTASDYTFLQFTPANISFRASSPSNEFIYYYGSGLPQGTRLVLDPSGISADVSGIVTQYSSAYAQSYIFARQPIAGYIAQFPFTTRVLSPFVLKPQTSAAGYTAYLRQYVEVNGAQNARDAVTFPVQENPIGKFTSPGIGDVVTDSNCPC